jgi:ribokinase
MTVAVFGSINLDVTAYLDRLPQAGETRYGTSYKLGLGGKGANQAVAARKLGSEVDLIGRTGTDVLGDAALKEIHDYGVSTALIQRDADAGTGIAIINVGEGGENTISLIGGGNLAVGPVDIKRGRVALRSAKVLLLQLEVPFQASLEAARITRTHGGIAILDPAPAPRTPLSRADLEAVDILTPNEGETYSLIGRRPETPEDALWAARELRSRGVGTAIVKIGVKGVAVSGNEEAFLPAFRVDAIDTVAAGDTFNGGLANALERGVPLIEAVRFASACAALSTTRKGAASAAPTRAEVEAFLAKVR